MEVPTRGIRRLIVVAAVALLSFAGAIVVLADDARLGCAVGGTPDPTLQVSLPPEFVMSRTDYEIGITRGGDPVSGARVCARVSMRGMEAMGFSDDKAEETAPGTYRINVTLPMGGAWTGTVLVTEPGKPQVSVPLEFTVR